MTKRVTRRGLLRQALIVSSGAAIYGAMPRRANAAPSISKAKAGYQAHPGDEHRCSGCCMFVPGGKGKESGTCTMIEGPISPHGWCKYWTGGPNDTCS
jgi:hypothetical protein